MMARRDENRKPPKLHYQVQMVKDFLDNLLWELRTVHYEVTAPLGPGGLEPGKGPIHRELQEQLAKYMRKYHHVGLMAVNSFPRSEEGVSEELRQEAIAYFRAARATLLQEWIDHLEALRPLFREAFLCAANPTQHLCRGYKYSDFLKHRGFGTQNQAGADNG
jgi:hypothetical protein